MHMCLVISTLPSVFAMDCWWKAMEMTVLWISNSWIKKLVVKCSWRRDEEMTQTLIVLRGAMPVAIEIVTKMVTKKELHVAMKLTQIFGKLCQK